MMKTSHPVETERVEAPRVETARVETARAETARGAALGPDAGVGDLVKQASQQLSELVRGEIRLAAAEIADKGKHAGAGVGMLGGAGVVTGYGVAALLVSAGAALALVWPVWAAALVVGAVLLIIAAVLALAGRKQVNRATPPLPSRAMESTRLDVAEIKERAHR
jgi:uncharacterized membrane protein YqjE